MNEVNATGFEYRYEQKLAQESPVKKSYLIFKRMVDFLAALVLTILALPIVVLFGLLVKLETPGPMFYRQERVGLMGRRIYVTKLRSMYSDAEKKSGAMWAQKNDARVTKVGRFIRMTRIDELPQILNVLSGEMSLIGPRPERPAFTEQFSNEYPGFEERLLIRPGLSGWAQVTGGYEDTPGQKLEKDRYYMANVSFTLDFEIVLMTIKTVITGEGAR
ncbi:UDP-phosphate N-acetylgalactosaminyl-1-phosphate transferase [Weissella confusa]|nr:UDP-phosphate N-acetylgalactosaminyl-1-phosphate transferase [Weissella confusa]